MVLSQNHRLRCAEPRDLVAELQASVRCEFQRTQGLQRQQNDMVFHNLRCKDGFTYTESDEQGRISRTANADGIRDLHHYRGDEEEPYLEQSCDTAGNMQSQTVSEYNPKTGETTRTSTIFEGVLTGTWITVKDARGSILRMENNVHDPNYEMMQDNEWTYDDTERTAVCVSEDGVTEKIWYDEQQRVTAERILHAGRYSADLHRQ